MEEDKAFFIAFSRTIGHEGGYVDDPTDPGGETKFGISKRSYPGENIRTLTVERARELYRRDYWDRLKLGQISAVAIAGEIFDTAVNMGRQQATLIAQRAVNFLGGAVAEDGIMGPGTLGALNYLAVKDAEALFRCLNGEQYAVYKEIIEHRPLSQKYVRGWMRRIQDYRQEG